MSSSISPLPSVARVPRALSVLGPVLVLALAGGLLLAPQPTHAAEPRLPTAAVLYLDYAGDDEELFALRKGLAQMLISDLSHSTGFKLVERIALQAVLDELELGRSKKIDPSTAARVGKLLGADYLVMGGYFEFRGSLRVDVRVVKVETGELVRGLGATGKGDDFLGLQQELARGLTTILEGLTTAKPPAIQKRPQAPQRVKTKTAARYGKALDHLDKGEKEAAKKELEAVVKEEPDFGLAVQDLAGLMQ